MATVTVTETGIGQGVTVAAGVGRYLQPLAAYLFTRLPGNPSTFSPIQWSFNSNQFTRHKLIQLARLGLKCKAQTALLAELAPAHNKP